MAVIHEGKLGAAGFRFAVVVSRTNGLVTDRLLSGALEALARSGADDDAIAVFKVPGAFEVPAAARKALDTGRFDAVVALACVIRGETPHFDYIAAEVSRGLGALALERGVPVAFGVLTVDSLEQAMERVGGKAGHKGAEAASAAVEMASLFRAMSSPALQRRKAG